MLGESLRERFGDRPEVPLRHDALKLLASDTRLGILKLLDQRRMTVSELARALDLNKSTVHEHLGKLVEGGLIKRDESEEREFVYYELTKTAKYVLYPATARFVLMMAAAVAAGVVLVALLHFALTAGQGLALAADGGAVPAGEAKVWEADVSQPGFLGFRAPASDAQLYLLTADQAAEYQVTHALPVDVAPLGSQEGLAEPSPGHYTFRVALDPGVHDLLARGGGLPDALFPLRAEQVVVEPKAPVVLVGVDPPQVEVAVQFDGHPVGAGLVEAVDPQGRSLAEVPVLNGKAALSLSAPADQVQFRFRAAAAGSRFAPALGQLRAPAAQVAFEPQQVPLLVPAEVRVVVDDPTQGPRAGAPVTLVRADTGAQVAAATTNASGDGSLDVKLTQPGDLLVKAGDVVVGKVSAMPGLRVWLDPGPHWEGDRFRVRSLYMGQEPNPVAGASILLDGRDVGTTDQDGWLTLQFGLGGVYDLQAVKDGFVAGETSVQVLPRTGWVLGGVHAGFAAATLPPSAPGPAPLPGAHVDDASLPPGGSTQVHAVLRNPDDVPRVLRAELWDNGRVVAVKGVEAPAGGDAAVTFDYAPASPGVHVLNVNGQPAGTVLAEAGGAAAAPVKPVPAPEPALALLALAGPALLARRRR